MVRCFISVDVEDDAILDTIADAQRTLLDCGADLKPVERQNTHLTLRFIGEVSEDMVQEVANFLEEVRFEPFKLSFKGVGAFPNDRFIRIIWVGVESGGEELKRIASAIDSKLRLIRVPSDKKGFSPHLTIARVRSQRNTNKVSALLRVWKDRDFGSQQVNSIRLKKSVLTPTGPVYSTLFERSAQKR
ncbi:MAG: RNA 2',3'-cyclic phosphodiesterase [Candidatus Bathyarchaeia archaeon]